ncbi:MAG: family 16 glycoside hydrolase, partial [Rhizomicrobium sp.]
MHTTGHEGDALYTGDKIGNATIHVVYKMSNDKGNSGVFIRIPSPPPDENTPNRRLIMAGGGAAVVAAAAGGYFLFGRPRPETFVG